MKKLFIAITVAIISIASQAALFKWSSSDTLAGTLYDGTTTKAAAGTKCYLFDAAVFAQDAAYNAFKSGTISTKLSSAIADTTLNSNSRVTEVLNIEHGTAGVNSTMYWIALIGDDKMYISNTITDAPVDVGGTPLNWTDVRATSNNGVKTAFAGAGVYGAAIPEPTSGVLLLLGIAGVALRRRRA